MTQNEQIPTQQDEQSLNGIRHEPQTPSNLPDTFSLPNSAHVNRPNKNWKKLAFVVFAIIAFVSILLFCFVYILSGNKSRPDPLITSVKTPSSEDGNNSQSVVNTTNWKTATNKEYGYRYKYPASTDKYRWVSLADAGNVEVGAGSQYVEFTYNPFLITIAQLGSEADDGSVFRSNIEVKKFTENEYFKLSSTEQVTKNGVAGTCWEFTAKEASIYVGKKEIDCHFIKQNTSFFFNIQDIRYKKGQKALDATKDLDLVAIGEAILDSFEFTN